MHTPIGSSSTVRTHRAHESEDLVVVPWCGVGPQYIRGGSLADETGRVGHHPDLWEEESTNDGLVDSLVILLCLTLQPVPHWNHLQQKKQY